MISRRERLSEGRGTGAQEAPGPAFVARVPGKWRSRTRTLETTWTRAAGVGAEGGVADPGVGFAETGAQTLALLARLGESRGLGLPILVGPGRKRLTGELTGAPAREGPAGTSAACVMAYLQGASIFRVHDVEPVVEALTVTRAVVEAAE